jgi:hypothetical protein
LGNNEIIFIACCQAKEKIMVKNGFVKKMLLLAVLAGISASGAFAQITISGGFALSSVSAVYKGEQIAGGTVGIGGNVYLDYLLPISVPLSLGGELGIDSATISDGFDNTVLAIPILLRAAYHFDLLPKLDLYVVGKIGYVIGAVSGSLEPYLDSAGGVGFGIDVGAAYYFTPLVGAFIEGGLDGYMIKAEFLDDWGSYTLDAPFLRFLTFGLSVKF